MKQNSLNTLDLIFKAQSFFQFNVIKNVFATAPVLRRDAMQRYNLVTQFIIALLFLFAGQVFAATSSKVSEVVTTTSYDDHGNPTTITVSTTCKDTTCNGDTHTTYTANQYYPPNETQWFLDRLQRTEVTQYLPSNGDPRDGTCSNSDPTTGTCGTRTSSFEYNANGLLSKEIIEPDTPSLRLETTYGYDTVAFGNKTSVTVTGGSGATAIASRTTTTMYDARGQFAISTTNALGHNETRTYDAKFGVMKTLTGPNQLMTTWVYDSFGRQTSEVRADGTSTTVTREWCHGFQGESGNTACPLNGALSVTTQASGAPTSVAYSDALGRELRVQSQGFDGTLIYVDTEYNQLGQVVAKSRPYYAGSTSYWHAIEYDVVGRSVKRIAPHPDHVNGVETTTSYVGLSVSETNVFLSQTNTRTNNAIGQLVSTEDNLNNIATYEYEPFGNLRTLTDSNNNTTTNLYDLRGRKTGMDDPDMGIWSYTYNALGELVSQTDAKSQTVTMTYDKLGRMTQRVEAEGTSTWVYDYASGSNYAAGQTAHSIGKLISVSSAEGKDESYVYDGYGRLSSTSTTITGVVGTHVQEQTYDSSGRVDVITYPQRAHDSGRLKVKHQYNARGYLDLVYNADDITEEYYTVMLMDAEGKVTKQKYDNGVITNMGYTPETGLVNAIGTSSPALVNNIQDLTFTFDVIGNLTEREDITQTNTESFLYDDLNRIKQSVLNGTIKNYTYDALGNIKTKTGVSGTYIYGGPRPHAVTSIGGHNVLYDANGNVTQNYNFTASATRTITWSSYNKPLQIDQGSTNIAFKYGASREMVQQTVTNGSNPSEIRTYVNSVFEIDGKVGKTTYIHYLKAGGQTIGLFKSIDDISSTNNDTEETRYLHRDHLGSITAITDETAGVAESLSYDPHGKRRQPTWDDAIAQVFSSETNRCFTGHQYLDDVGLIHMGGRVYDPDLGRFLSPDPFIQYPEVQQNFNRYTYVNNNPLSFTDPSGHFIIGLIAAAIVAVTIGDDIIDFVTDVIDGVLGFINSTLNKITGGNSLINALVIGVTAWYTGGLAYNAALDFAAGAIASGSAITLEAAFTVANIIGGATGGFVFGAITGGDLESGVLGGLSGAALGGVKSYFGNTWSASRVLANGTIGGARSELEGGDFLDGFKSSTAFSFANAAFKYNSTLQLDGTNSGYNFEGKVFRGSLDVASKIWAGPNTIVGLTYGGIGHLVGLAMNTNPNITFENNAVQFTNNPLMATAMTFGNAVIYGQNVSPDSSNVHFLKTPTDFTVYGEEFRHTLQSQILGPAYFPSHIIGGMTSIFREPHPDLLHPVDKWHQNNFMETGPMQDTVF